MTVVAWDPQWVRDAAADAEDRVLATEQHETGYWMLQQWEWVSRRAKLIGTGALLATLAIFSAYSQPGTTVPGTLPSQAVEDMAAKKLRELVSSPECLRALGPLAACVQAPPTPSVTVDKSPKILAKVLLVFLPAIIIAFAAWFALARCYPRWLFLWGDFVNEENDRRMQLRNTCWQVVVISFIVGVVGNLFVMGLTSALAIG